MHSRCLEQLTLYLQSHEANILNACSYIDNTINKLQSLKDVKFPLTSQNDDDDAADDSDGGGSDNTEVEKQVVVEEVSTCRKEKGNVTTLHKILAQL